MPAARRGAKKPGKGGSGAGIIFGMVVGAAATVGLALYTPIGGKLVQATRRTPVVTGPKIGNGNGIGIGSGMGNVAGKSSVPAPVPVPVPVAAPDHTVGVGGLVAGKDKDKDVVAPIPKVTPDAGQAIAGQAVAAAAPPEETADDEAPAVKAEDGSNEDVNAPPAEAPAAPHREMPQVRSVSDVDADQEG